MVYKNRQETKDYRQKSAERRARMKMSYTLSADDFNSVVCAQKGDKKGTQKNGEEHES